MKSKSGSALVMVLWVTILLGFLAAQHVAHNRDKASVAIGAMDQLNLDQTIQSIIALYQSNSTPFPEQSGNIGRWNVISVNGMDVFVRLDQDSKRTLISVSNDAKIRELVRNSLMQRAENISEREATRKADEITDALLDWIDNDDLRRTSGAEDEDYIKRNLNYLPANEPFRTFTEMLLVLGVSEAFFWGDPLDGLIHDLETGMGGPVPMGTLGVAEGRRGKNIRKLGLERADRYPDFWDTVTIYPYDVKRLTLISTNRENGYWLAVIFLEAGNVRSQVLEDHRLVFPSNESIDHLNQLILMHDRMKDGYWKRYILY